MRRRYGRGTTIEDFEQVLEAARAGEAWASTALFDALQPPLLRYLRWEEPSAADDIVGETWLALAERIGEFQGRETALRAWMFSVARGRVADRRSSGARRRTQPVSPDQFVDVAGGPDPADVVLGTLSAQQAIDQLVAGLTPEQAQVIVLRVVGGLPVEDVAKVLGKRPETVRVTQHRALRRLGRQNSGDRTAPRGT